MNLPYLQIINDKYLLNTGRLVIIISITLLFCQTFTIHMLAINVYIYLTYLACYTRMNSSDIGKMFFESDHR